MTNQPYPVNELVSEALREMQLLGIEPEKENSWQTLALTLLRDRLLLGGMPKAGDEETIEIRKVAHKALHKIAGPAVRFVDCQKRVEASYQEIKKPTQNDVLEHAIVALMCQCEWLDELGIDAFGGLPTPLRIVQADLINVKEGRFGRSISPSDRKIANAKRVADSHRDRLRLVVCAYSAATVKRLIDQGSEQSAAYKQVCAALGRAGFHAPGRDTSPAWQTVRTWYESTMEDKCPFADEYQQALRPAEAKPEDLLKEFEYFVRSLCFKRCFSE